MNKKSLLPDYICLSARASAAAVKRSREAVGCKSWLGKALTLMSAQNGPAFLSALQIGLLTALHSSQTIVGEQQFYSPHVHLQDVEAQHPCVGVALGKPSRQSLCHS